MDLLIVWYCSWLDQYWFFCWTECILLRVLWYMQRTVEFFFSMSLSYLFLVFTCTYRSLGYNNQRPSRVLTFCCFLWSNVKICLHKQELTPDIHYTSLSWVWFLSSKASLFYDRARLNLYMSKGLILVFGVCVSGIAFKQRLYFLFILNFTWFEPFSDFMISVAAVEF